MTTDTITVGKDELTVHARFEGGLAVDTLLPAGGGPPGLHRHAPGEIYRLLEGELAFYRGRGERIERATARAGDVVQIHPDEEHTIRNESSEPARSFVIFHGDGVKEIEAFFRAAAEASDPAAVLELAREHGVELTRPL